jgi:hypothetical protein
MPVLLIICTCYHPHTKVEGTSLEGVKVVKKKMCCSPVSISVENALGFGNLVYTNMSQFLIAGFRCLSYKQ